MIVPLTVALVDNAILGTWRRVSLQHNGLKKNELKRPVKGTVRPCRLDFRLDG